MILYTIELFVGFGYNNHMESLKAKINQLFILGYEGDDINKNLDIVRLIRQGLGGVIFFSQNITDEKLFKSQIKFIKSIAKFPPFLSIDEEGGRVERFENINKKYPNGKKYLSAKFIAQKGINALKKQTQSISNDLKKYGLNMNFSPVLDVNSNTDNPIIGERAYSDNPDEVSKFALLVNEIYNKNGIITVGKHFPGHGDTKKDSHLELPTVNISFEEFEKTHIYPFKMAVENNIPAIMVSHVHYDCFDGNSKAPETVLTPASTSKNVLKYLRENLKYDGVVISDDMCMGALSGFNHLETIIKMLKNGVNCFIYRNCSKEVVEILTELENAAQTDEELKLAIKNSYQKLIKLKMDFWYKNYEKSVEKETKGAKKKKLKLDIIGFLIFLGFKFQIPLTKFIHINKPDTSNSFIVAMWHAHQCSLYGFKEVIKRVNILISPSSDGQVIADACSRLGFKIIRGSKGRKGASKSVMQMYDALQNNEIVSVMIDGPNGPKHIVQPGVIELAKLSGKPIIPMVWYSPKKNFLKFNSWDEYRVPLGPCKVVNLYGEPIYVDKNADENEFERKRLEVENSIKNLYDDLVKNYERYLKNAK